MTIPLAAHTFSIAPRRTLRYVRTSDSAPSFGRSEVALFHGVLRAGNIFAPLVAHLGGRYDLWLLDQRGHGGSTPAERYLIVDYVADAVAWLRSCVARPIVLYGHSLGAMVAAGAAAACPELVRGCILEDPPFRTLGPHIGATNFLSYFSQVAALLRQPRDARELPLRLADIAITDPASGKSQRLGELRDGVALRFLAATLQQLDPEALKPLIAGRWLEGYDENAIFAGIRCPVLLLQADPALGGMLIDEDAERFQRLAPDTTRIRMPGVGHMMHWQRTQEIANLTFGFVESLGA